MTPPACPTCGKPAAEATRPFCSRRCANIDLQRWLSGAYAIPGADAPDDEHPGDAEGNDPSDDTP
ncbi:MAG: DNA gyrase inhibitor YacG [Caulobacteraceae bacterium]